MTGRRAEAAAIADPSGTSPADGAEVAAIADPTPEEQAEVLEAIAEEDGDVEVVMLLHITGLRNGEAWPARGQAITLPADEALNLVRNGYATAV